MSRITAPLWVCLAVFLFSASCTMPSKESSPVPFYDGYKHLLLMHPTINNIKTIQYLVDKGIMPLPDSYRIVGVYNKAAAYDYAQSQTYIEQNGLDRFSLYGTDPFVDADKLFGNHELSETFAWLFHNSEGVFFMGGPDIPPAVYTHPTNLLTSITDPNRHYLELSFLFHLLGGEQDPDMIPLLEEDPFYCVLGICLGMQSMNVATGGTLYQDIPTELYGAHTVEDVFSLEQNQIHRNYYTVLNTDANISPYFFHQVVSEPESIMASILGNSTVQPYVLSSHHQAVKDLGRGFRVSAWSADRKIVEAIEHTDYPNVLGIQFHPEPYYLYDINHKITFVPGETPGNAFLDLYPGELGEDFHRAFWKYISTLYQ